MLVDLSNAEYSDRAGTYGGNAGNKDGIIYNGEYWLVKYPKSTKGMNVKEISYTTSPLSEYIGSQIYRILGYDVHETMLGIRRNKLVVACKDFCEKEGALREIRTIKNFANEELSELLEKHISSTDSTNLIDFDEILLHLTYNEILRNVPGLRERFFDCIVIDVLINNNDRNNGNWGVLYKDGKYSVAPVFDNGAAFSTKLSDMEIVRAMEEPEKACERSINTVTVFKREEKVLTAKKILGMSMSEMRTALEKNVPRIEENMDKIVQMIYDIPEQYGEISVCSKERKEFYILGIKSRLEKLLIPALEKQQLMDKEKSGQKPLNYFGKKR